MRVLIVFLLFFCCSFTSILASEAKTCSINQKTAEKAHQFNKKQKNSLRTALFSEQIDVLHLNHQHQSLHAIHFFKCIFGWSAVSAKTDLKYTLNASFLYSFLSQYLYPKHSFW